MNDFLRKIQKKGPFIACVFVGFTILFFFLGYDLYFHKGPFGMHFMRQTDSLSFVSQYYNNGFHFFDPQLFNLKNIDGRAACEFPIVYYFTSLLYLIVGKKIFLLKGIHLLISFTGLFFVYRLSYLILKDYVYALLIALFICTSTVYNFYAFNYLPDTGALGFTLIAWYYVFEYMKSDQKSSIIKAFTFFTLGSLIKVTYLINPIAVIVFYAFMALFKRQALDSLKNKAALFKYFAITILLVFSWNAYMLYYNQQNESHSFNTTALPIWELSRINIEQIWDYMMNFWYTSYFAHSSFHILLVLALFQLVFIKKSNYSLSLLTFVLMLGCFTFGLLFYAQFKDHDYYFLTFIPFVVLILINGINTFLNLSRHKTVHLITKLTLLVIVIAGINYSRNKLSSRYNASNDVYSRTGMLIQENKSAIDALNIPENAKFIVAPDPCQNGGLFCLNRMGWTIDSPDKINLQRIINLQEKGAQYLLFSKKDLKYSTIGNQIGDLILNTEEILIYKLR